MLKLTLGEVVIAAYKEGFRMGMGLAVEGQKPIDDKRACECRAVVILCVIRLMVSDRKVLLRSKQNTTTFIPKM